MRGWRMLVKRLRKMVMRSDERGATLIEIVLIIVILGITVIPLSRLSIVNNIAAGKYITMTQGIGLAQSVMESVAADWLGGGFDVAVANWSGATVTEGGLTATVNIGGEMHINGVSYSVVQVTVTGPGIDNAVGLESMIVR